MVQSIHSAVDFIYQFANDPIVQSWKQNSNYIVAVAAKDETGLKDLIHQLQIKNIKHTVFIEPDIEDQITSVCLEPTSVALKSVSHLPLALKAINEGMNKNNFKQNILN